MTLEQWEMERSQCWTRIAAATIAGLHYGVAHGIVNRSVPTVVADEAVAEWEKRFPRPYVPEFAESGRKIGDTQNPRCPKRHGNIQCVLIEDHAGDCITF